MTIEAAQFISQLNPSFPRSTDLLKEGDDHIRMVKASLQRTFPRITSSLTISSETLNNLDANVKATTSGIVLQNSLTVAAGKTIDMGNNAVKQVGWPVADTDAITVAWFKAQINHMYPVGMIVCTGNLNQNPASLGYPGTWQAHWPGCYMASAGSAAGAFNIPVGQFGSTSFSLGVQHIPAHSHVIPEHGHGAWSDGAGQHAHVVGLRSPSNHDGAGSIYGTAGGGGYNGAAAYGKGGNGIDLYPRTSDDGNHSHTIRVGNQGRFNTENTGSGQAYGYQPKAFGAYWWIRNA